VPQSSSAVFRAGLVAAAALFLSACAGDVGRFRDGARVEGAPPASAPSSSEGRSVALILPLGAPGNAGVVAQSMRNAAELAVEEYKGAKIRLIVKDDGGTPDGARAAATAALSEGAEVVLGPLLAPSVQSAAQVLRSAGRPMIAFSTDASVAGRGVNLLSFMPENDIDRVVEFAAQRGKRSFAALVPEGAYGNVAAAAFQAAVTRRGLSLATVERYAPGGEADAAKALTGLRVSFDALFVPENGERAAAVGQALADAGVDAKRVQILGSGVWDDPRVQRVPQFQGGWYAAPDKAGFNAFAQRYRARFGSEPTRIASLAYDAVFLVGVLGEKYGADAFSEATLTNPDGILGTDGLFAFRPDGTGRRALAVLQVGNGSAQVIAPAPRSFAPAGQ